jgi:hypothetical protein
MKAIELINAMCYDSAIAENGATVILDGRNLSDYFGTTKPFEGYFPNGIYFYLYIEQGEEPYFYHLLGMPNAVNVRDEEKDVVALWRVE